MKLDRRAHRREGVSSATQIHFLLCACTAFGVACSGDSASGTNSPSGRETAHFEHAGNGVALDAPKTGHRSLGTGTGAGRADELRNDAAKPATAYATAVQVGESGTTVAESEEIAAPIIVVRGFEEPLIRTAPTSDAEDAAIKRAVAQFHQPVDASSNIRTSPIEGFETFVDEYPSSGWNASILTNLGLVYYQLGFFSRAFDAWTKAWKDGKAATEPTAKALVDRAVGELARMHARVGHADELEALFKEIGTRPITGRATELITGAHEGAWEMRNNPGNAFLCGPKALGNVLRALGTAPAATAFLDDERSGRRGFSLHRLAGLAKRSRMAHRLIHRSPGQAIPVPSVINWKVDHYAAIVSEADGAYHVQDPTFGGDLIVSRAAIDAEASGYFLVPSTAAADLGWREVTNDEAHAVHGMGFTASSDEGATKPDDTKVGGGGGNRCSDNSHGMCTPDAHAMTVSLNLNDTPVGYAPQKGPPVFIKLTYNQREATQPANPTYFNVGPKWTLNVLSYVQDWIEPLGQDIYYNPYPELFLALRAREWAREARLTS